LAGVVSLGQGVESGQPEACNQLSRPWMESITPTCNDRTHDVLTGGRRLFGQQPDHSEPSRRIKPHNEDGGEIVARLVCAFHAVADPTLDFRPH
jgi:hypothetical protein